MQKIKEIAFRLGEHPIHIKMFLLHCKECLKLINDEIILDKYAQFKKDSPKPFVKWVGGKRQYF